LRGYCFDTDTLSAVVRRDPPLLLIRRVATVPPEAQFTTAITLGELLYGVARRGSTELSKRVHRLVEGAVAVLPFDRSAAETYGWLRAELESAGTRLAEPDLRIASIAMVRGLTLVSGNVRHFGRVPGLQLENWLEG
jgi:predicted nucleic acid-binding protein